MLHEMKLKGEKIAMLTAYDYSSAKILDEAEIDVILVGDSASNVMAGYETTLPVTLDNMICYAASVVRGVKRALVVVDLPFGTYQGDSKEALASSIRIMKETGAHAVKLEGGTEIVESVKRILSAGIPVMGHLGLTPSRYTSLEHMRSEPKRMKRPKNLLKMLWLLKKRVVSPLYWRRFQLNWQGINFKGKNSRNRHWGGTAY